jgi:hypothetical protein
MMAFESQLFVPFIGHPTISASIEASSVMAVLAAVIGARAIPE